MSVLHAPPGAHRRVHACRAGREPILLDELKRVFRASHHQRRGPGLVESELASGDAVKTACLAFATQCLPESEELCAGSVAGWARTVGERIIAGLADHGGPWRLHTFCPDGAPVRAGRGALIEEAVLELLKKKQRRLIRSRVEAAAPAWSEDEALVQLAVESPDCGLLSFCPPALRLQLRRCLSQFPGGIVEVPRDPRPPSRAYLKLLEAQAHLGRRIAPGEMCVDLGASPGGWTFVALEQGARVVAVDRSPLREDLMRHPRLTFVRGDAFAWEPPTPVDWLLCDVIAFPQRTTELLARWLAGRLCRRFCVTVKFRGQDDYPRLDEIERILEREAAGFRVRQLGHNKNEVTAMGEATAR